MKNILFSIAIFISTCTFAQTDKFLVYEFEGKSGLTDTLSNELLPPKYWGPDYLYHKKQWVFDNDSEGVIFNEVDGKATYYEEIRSYHLEYKDSMYMRISDKGKLFLLNQYSNTRFDLPKGRENIKTAGDYFYLTEMVSTESLQQNQYQLFKKPSDAKPVFEISATEMNTLWKINNYNSHFDYTSFTTEKQIKIYDHNLKLIKTISKPKGEYLDIAHLVSEALKQGVMQRYAPPMMASLQVKEYPSLAVRNQGEQHQVFIENENADPNPLFLFTTNNDVNYRGNTIYLKKENSNFAQFNVNLKTGKIYYPKVYLDQLGLGFTQKEDTKIYENIIPSAGFAGGGRAMLDFIKDNLIYPREVKRGKIEGKVVVKFVVEKDGSISNIEIERSLSKECDAEVIRVISKMPKWTPAKKDEIAVRSLFRVPVMFRVQ